MSAYISEDGLYRYTLERVDLLDNGDTCTFVMLNPSTADATTDDRTVGRCTRFARDWGYGRLRVVNLYAYRATHPKNLWLADDPVGPENDRVLALAFQESDLTIAAWGGNGKSQRVREVMALPYAPGWALRLGKNGVPWHPLYIPTDTRLVKYGERETITW